MTPLSALHQRLDEFSVGSAATADPTWKWLYRVGGRAALIVGLSFLIAIISLITTGLQPAVKHDWLMWLQNNWLVVLFQFNAGLNGVQFDLLHGPDLLDIGIMALVATMFLSLYVALRRTSKIWSLIALSQPFLGIVLFIATQMAGRSAVMGATLVISLVMLRSRIFGRVVAFVGILASLLLLVGDFGTTADSSSTILATFIGTGYVLLMTWFFLIAQRLFQLAQHLEKRTLAYQS